MEPTLACPMPVYLAVCLLHNYTKKINNKVNKHANKFKTLTKWQQILYKNIRAILTHSFTRHVRVRQHVSCVLYLEQLHRAEWNDHFTHDPLNSERACELVPHTPSAHAYRPPMLHAMQKCTHRKCTNDHSTVKYFDPISDVAPRVTASLKKFHRRLQLQLHDLTSKKDQSGKCCVK